MRAHADTRVRVQIARPRPCVLRMRWWAGGRLLGDKRVYAGDTVLHTSAGPVVIEITDDRPIHDPARLAPARIEVVAREGWCVDTSVTMRPGAWISGRIRRDGGPARFAVVTAHLGDGTRLETRCDGLGEYTLAGLPTGIVRVGATERGRASAHASVATSAERPTWAPLDLTLREIATPVVMPRVVGGALRGSVVDPSGTPSYLAIVRVRDARGRLLARARTDRSGTFIVGGDLSPSPGLSLEVVSGPEHIRVVRTERRGLGVHLGQVVDLGQIVLATPVSLVEATETPARRSRPAMRLPATRV